MRDGTESFKLKIVGHWILWITGVLLPSHTSQFKTFMGDKSMDQLLFTLAFKCSETAVAAHFTPNCKQ